MNKILPGSKIPEKALQSHILQYLRSSGYFVWRQNSGVVMMHGHQYRMSDVKGVADIIGMTKEGKFLAIEVKAKSGYQNENQKLFEQRVKESNGIYIIARSIADVARVIPLDTYNPEMLIN